MDKAEEHKQQTNTQIQTNMDTHAVVEPIPAPVPLADFPRGYSWYRGLGSPRLVVAPMVNQSELAFRLLTKKYGAQLTYTPMFNAQLFANNDTYRREQFDTCHGDRPLIVQFCANDPHALLKAAKHIEHAADAVDINLGCPQGIARRGHYGAFLLEETDLICSLVSALHRGLAIPVTCKIRLLPTLEATIRLAKRLEAAGCSLLTVHGRSRHEIKDRIGRTNFAWIAAVKAALSIPVIANGSIENMQDVNNIIDMTKCDGVMTSEGILCNPALYHGEPVSGLLMARQYIELAEQHQTHSSIIRAHLFKILFKELACLIHMRDALSTWHESSFMAFLDLLEGAIAAEDADAWRERVAAVPRWYRRHLTDKEYEGKSVIELEKKSLEERIAAKQAEALARQGGDGDGEGEAVCLDDFACMFGE